MLSLQWIRQKMGLASYIVQQTSEFVSHLDTHTYYPMDMTHTGASLPPLELMLPDSLWPETGHKLTQVRKFAKSVCQSHYVRIVDKGVGVLWAFCRHWVWGIIQQFLKSEGYTPSPKTLPQAMAFVSAELDAGGWDRNTAGQLPLLYLLGKFKSLAKGKWLWRGITSLPQPLLPKKSLRIAARANTAFLRLLCQEGPLLFSSSEHLRSKPMVPLVRHHKRPVHQ